MMPIPRITNMPVHAKMIRFVPSKEGGVVVLRCCILRFGVESCRVKVSRVFSYVMTFSKMM
jgi:hypothetical protein